MANLYDFIGASPGTTTEDIERLIQITRTRLQQTGHLYQEGNEERLEEAHRVLTDPAERAVYDAKHGIAPQASPESQPAAPANSDPATRRRRLMLLVVLFAVLASIIGFFSMRRFQQWPTGIYLNSVVNGQRAAVFLEREANHTFPNGKVLTACKVRMLSTDEIRWMSETQLHAEFEKGSPAAPNDIK